MKKYFVIMFVALLAGSPGWSFAQIVEQEATPSVTIEPGATFLIMEVNFKNTEHDFARMKYTSPSGKPLNLKGIGFGDDSVFKRMETDVLIASGQELLLTWKESKTDQIPYIYTARTGLTGTTEQFYTVDPAGNILDAVCWTSDSPTSSEINDLAELAEKEGWSSELPESCLQSATIETSESIIRKPGPDTNTAADWQEENPPEIPSMNQTEPLPVTTIANSTSVSEPLLTDPGLMDLHMPVATTTTGAITVQDDEEPLSPLPLTTVTSPPKQSTAATKKKKNTSKAGASYANGDLSADIKISEIMPNPAKEDAKNEWIELVNNGTEAVNLGNWQLDDDEGGSKPFIVSDTLTIAAGETALFPITQTRISLANGEDRIRLFDFKGELMDEITYEDAAPDQSFSRIQIVRLGKDTDDNVQSPDEWLWTSEPTPGATNPQLFEFTGKVTEEPVFADQYSFQVLTDLTGESQKTFTVLFDEGTLAAPLAKASFKKDTVITILAAKITDDTFGLKKYEIVESAEVAEDTSPYIIGAIVAIMACGAGGYYLYKKIPWKKNDGLTDIDPATVQIGGSSDIMTL